MENRKSMSNVRALCEKFEMKTDEHKPLIKSASQNALSKSSSLSLNDPTSTSDQIDGSILNDSIRSTLPVPLPPSVLQSQVLKPRRRPLSFSEATVGSSVSILDEMETEDDDENDPPEKPPRTFLYHLVPPPIPGKSSISYYENTNHESLRRKLRLTPKLSLPQNFDDRGNILKENQLVPLERKVIYITDQKDILPSSESKRLLVKSLTPSFSTNSNSNLRNYENSSNSILNRSEQKEYGSSRENQEIDSISSSDLYPSVSSEIANAHPKISKANIRAVQQVNSSYSACLLLPKDGSQSNNTKFQEQQSFSSKSYASPKLLRANTLPDILSSSSSLYSSHVEGWKEIPIPILDSSDYGSTQEDAISDFVDGSSNTKGYSTFTKTRGTQDPLEQSKVQIQNPSNNDPIKISEESRKFQNLRNSKESMKSCNNTSLNCNSNVYPFSNEEILQLSSHFYVFKEGSVKNNTPIIQENQNELYQYNILQKSKCSNSQFNENKQLRSYVKEKSFPERFDHRYNIKSNRRVNKSRSELDLANQISNYDWTLKEVSSVKEQGDITKEYIDPRQLWSHHHPHPPKFLPLFQYDHQQLIENNNVYLPSRNCIYRHSTKDLHQSIHNLTNQIYPSSNLVVHTDQRTTGKDSSTDSGIQLGTESLSSCDTPLTGDTTPDTVDSDCENEDTEILSTRQVIEKRKGYIRRISSIRTTELLPFQRLFVGSRTLPPELCTHPPPSTLLDYKNQFRGSNSLFDNFLIIGIERDERTGAYHPFIKYKYPQSVELPEGIERFCFPDSLEWPCHEGSTAQFYTLTLTQSDGTRKYGCCFRILPDGANICIPVAYCIISQTRAIGFYRNVLKILASRHGCGDSQINFMSKQLYDETIPEPGKYLIIQDPRSALPIENIEYEPCVPISIRRKADARLDNTDIQVLISTLELSTIIKIFGSLLLERKIILLSKQLNLLSLCAEALESIMYPFSWQHTFVPILPLNMTELLEVPAPFVIGVLKSQVITWDFKRELDEFEGIVVDLDQRKILSSVGDEGSILPKRITKKLKEALQTVQNLQDQTEFTKNVLFSECFIRMFVEIIGHYRTNGIFEYPSYNPGGRGKFFKKDKFLKLVTSKSARDFLEWFIETSSFQQFIEERSKPNFRPGLFEQRCVEQLETSKEKNLEKDVTWRNTGILSKGAFGWIKGAFSKERE